MAKEGCHTSCETLGHFHVFMIQATVPHLPNLLL